MVLNLPLGKWSHHEHFQHHVQSFAGSFGGRGGGGHSYIITSTASTWKKGVTRVSQGVKNMNICKTGYKTPFTVQARAERGLYWGTRYPNFVRLQWRAKFGTPFGPACVYSEKKPGRARAERSAKCAAVFGTPFGILSVYSENEPALGPAFFHCKRGLSQWWYAERVWHLSCQCLTLDI